MCGRLACGLEPSEIRNSCAYKNSYKNDYITPIWKNIGNGGKQYKPSYNICPTELAPVLLAGSHFGMPVRIVAPMEFGIVPSWSKPSVSSKYSTINCRIENIKNSKLYGPLLQKGQRCIVVCNGFFEWKKENSGTEPYFICSKQPKCISIEDPGTWKLTSPPISDDQHFKPLFLAALFERTTPQGTEDEIYSFTIITKDSSSVLSWLHLRMPMMLETEEQIHIWLNHEEFNPDIALQCLNHFEKVIVYPVSKLVNDRKNKNLSCIRKKEKISEVGEYSQNLMKSWLGKRKYSAISESDEKCVKKEECEDKVNK